MAVEVLPEQNRLPYDIGYEAYWLLRLHHTENPFPEGDWRHEEWWLGWESGRESDPDSWDDGSDSFAERATKSG